MFWLHAGCLARCLGVGHAAVSPVAEYEPGDQSEYDQDDRKVQRAKGLADIPRVPGGPGPGQSGRPGERPQEGVEDELREVHAGHTGGERYEGADYGQQPGEKRGGFTIFGEPLIGRVQVVLADQYVLAVLLHDRPAPEGADPVSDCGADGAAQGAEEPGFQDAGKVTARLYKLLPGERHDDLAG